MVFLFERDVTWEMWIGSTHRARRKSAHLQSITPMVTVSSPAAASPQAVAWLGIASVRAFLFVVHLIAFKVRSSSPLLLARR